MNEKQKEAAATSAMGRCYGKISLAYERMPDRFRLLDILREAGIKDCQQVRGAVGSVLFRSFHCIDVGTGSNRVWKKPVSP